MKSKISLDSFHFNQHNEFQWQSGDIDKFCLIEEQDIVNLELEEDENTTSNNHDISMDISYTWHSSAYIHWVHASSWSVRFKYL